MKFVISFIRFSSRSNAVLAREADSMESVVLRIALP